MINTIDIAGRNPCSLIDGDGLRDVWYISKCTHMCLRCQNKNYWNKTGKTFKIQEIINEINKNELTDVTISGGDGLTIQYKSTLELLKQIKKQTNKNIWLYTGYVFEELYNSYKKECLNYIDILVDGKFEMDKRDISLRFVGSSNQRIINVQDSLRENKIIEWRS